MDLTYKQEVTVGALVLVGFLVFTAFMFWLTGRSIVSKAVPVQVEFANVQGLKEGDPVRVSGVDRKSTRLNSSHLVISYAVFCLKKKYRTTITPRTAMVSLAPAPPACASQLRCRRYLSSLLEGGSNLDGRLPASSALPLLDLPRY